MNKITKNLNKVARKGDTYLNASKYTGASLNIDGVGVVEVVVLGKAARDAVAADAVGVVDNRRRDGRLNLVGFGGGVGERRRCRRDGVGVDAGKVGAARA